jgi:hypothetical protein
MINMEGDGDGESGIGDRMAQMVNMEGDDMIN